jgi:hypothetical protein
MKDGRPTKYEPGFIEEVDKYLATTGKEQLHLPKICSFAIWLGVNESTIYAWEKIHPGFSKALTRIKDKQQEQLIDDGIYGGKEVNAVIVKLLLMNNHNMREKTDNEHSGKDGEPLEIIITEERRRNSE